MRAYIGLGSNIGEPKNHLRKNLERAISLVNQKYKVQRVSTVYENPPLLPENFEDSWVKSFLNAVVEIDVSQNTNPEDLLEFLKSIEKKMGRVSAKKWAPRIIDLDILTFGDRELKNENLQIPHKGLLNRSFCLDLLKELCPLTVLGKDSVINHSKNIKTFTPALMAIFNVTPDSFSDGGVLASKEIISNQIKKCVSENIQYIDLGAESTRPGAREILSNEEVERLKPVFEVLSEKFGMSHIRPKISLDTRRAETASHLNKVFNIDVINDVSGAPENWISYLKENIAADYVLMHSMSVPADPKKTFVKDCDVVEELKTWFKEKINFLVESGISKERIIIDPGVGFGKSAAQSLEILNRVSEFKDLDCRILIGHSRKSFMNLYTDEQFKERDFETLGASFTLLASRSADILRVHNFAAHRRAIRSWGYTYGN